MRKSLVLFVLMLSLLPLSRQSAAQGYSGVISSDRAAAETSSTASAGYGGVTSWDSVVSGSLYDFVNEAGASAAVRGQGSGGLAALIQKKRTARGNLIHQKAQFEKKLMQDYAEKEKAKILQQGEQYRREQEQQRRGPT